MRYLVTGGAGFIGSNLVDELVRRGQTVVVLDDLSSGKEENLAQVRSKIDLRIGNIADLAGSTRRARASNYVIHLAARTSVPRSVANPLETNQVNVDGTLNVLIAARDARSEARWCLRRRPRRTAKRPRSQKSETCPTIRFLHTAFRRSSAKCTPGFLPGRTAWKRRASGISMYSGRARIPRRNIRA